MIIFGTTTITTTPQSGVFHCPRCSMQRNYGLKRANRFFTLYFIPLIPMGSAGEWIQCSSCGGTFGQEVLSYNPEEERAELVGSVRRALVLLMLDTGATGSENLRTLHSFCANVLGAPTSDEQIYEDVQLAQQANAQLVPFVQSTLGDMNERGKELVMQGAVLVVAPDGQLAEAQKYAIRQLGMALTVHPQRVEALLSAPQQPRLE
jgi:hypothetical protein